MAKRSKQAETHLRTETVHYRYCYNSNEIDVQGERQIFSGTNRTHIPSLDGYQEGDKLTLAFEGGVAAPPTARGCEILFRIFNAPCERPEEYAGPSMSVGDVVTFFPDTKQAVSFSVASVGFIPTDISRSQIETRPARWIRNEEQLQEYHRVHADDPDWRP
jgi:hypothetical protein